MKIILSSDDINHYVQRMLKQDGLKVEGEIEWSWSDTEGPSAIVTLGTPDELPPEPAPVPKPRVEKVTVKLPKYEDQPESTKVSREREQDDALHDLIAEVPVAKPRKTRGPGKKKEAATKVSTDSNNVTDRVRQYQEDLKKNAGVLRHPITGDYVTGGHKPSSEYPKD